MIQKSKLTVQNIKEKKNLGEKITMLTAYDYPLAVCLDESRVDIILVGDSVANVVLGLDSTKDVGMNEMIHHAKAVSRGVKHSLLVGDMPYESYQLDSKNAVANAQKFISEAGCDAVKLEWFDECLRVTQEIVESGIAVMGHVGLTPQTAEHLGGFKIQGKDAVSAQEIINHAIALEEKGVFSIVLECIPGPLAREITKELSIPTIGIGAGVHCDGQVLVTHDLLGLFDRFQPKFAKQYLQLSQDIKNGVQEFCEEVKTNKFPQAQHSFAMSEEELKKLKRLTVDSKEVTL